MSVDYVGLIADHDLALSDLRKDWMAAVGEKNRAEAMRRINKALDYRLKLMKLRDTK